jgi:hypothetical protein
MPWRAAIAPRVGLLVSADGLPPYAEAARRLGRRLGRSVETTPGTHVAYNDHPTEFAQAIRQQLSDLTAITTQHRAVAVAHPRERRSGHGITSTERS